MSAVSFQSGFIGTALSGVCCGCRWWRSQSDVISQSGNIKTWYERRLPVRGDLNLGHISACVRWCERTCGSRVFHRWIKKKLEAARSQLQWGHAAPDQDGHRRQQGQEMGHLSKPGWIKHERGKKGIELRGTRQEETKEESEWGTKRQIGGMWLDSILDFNILSAHLDQ